MLKVVKGKGLDGIVTVTAFACGSPVFHWTEPSERLPSEALAKALTWDGGIREVFEAGMATGQLIERRNCNQGS